MGGNGNLNLRFKPQQGKELHYFVEAFIRNIRNHAKTARKKYPDTYEATSPDTIILDDDVTRKISPTIRRWLAKEEKWRLLPQSVDSTTRDERLRCPIPHDERKASSFSRRYCLNPCYLFFEKNGDAFFNQEIVKALLLYGEMDIILRLCAIPNVCLGDWWRVAECYCEVSVRSPVALHLIKLTVSKRYDAGWDEICYRALSPYIVLNLIYCFPETWDDASGRTGEKDYRLMWIYQCAVKDCTSQGGTSEIPTYPHRQFFGIEDDQFDRHVNRYDFCGKLPYITFLSSETLTPQRPTPHAVSQVQQLLRGKGLPAELILDILEKADFDPGDGRLKVPHDPFNLENREELAKYLRYCWELVVRCEMMANTIGMEVPWMEVLHTTLVRLLGGGLARRDWWYSDYERCTFI